MRLSKARFSVLAVLVLVLQPVTIPNAASAGRDSARCLLACHQLRVTCDQRCDEICVAMFPEGDEKYATCLSAGKTFCLEFEQEYRQICRSSRSGDPGEP